ncbi:hypothetical protein BC828DRAFT_385522, partial [Blastocladiella britannica]
MTADNKAEEPKDDAVLQATALRSLYRDTVLFVFLGIDNVALIDHVINIVNDAVQATTARTRDALVEAGHPEHSLHQGMFSIESLLSDAVDTCGDFWELFVFNYILNVPDYLPVRLDTLPLEQQQLEGEADNSPSALTTLGMLEKEIEATRNRIAALTMLGPRLDHIIGTVVADTNRLQDEATGWSALASVPPCRSAPTSTDRRLAVLAQELEARAYEEVSLPQTAAVPHWVWC